MFFLGTVVGVFVTVLLGLITLEIPGVHVALFQDWLGIAHSPPSPSVPLAVYSSVDFANDFYLLSKGNFTAQASPPSFDSEIPSPPGFTWETTASFVNKMFGILLWFLVVSVTNGLAFLLVAYTVHWSRKDHRYQACQALEFLDSRVKTLIHVLQQRNQASRESTSKDNHILLLQQMILDVENAKLDNFRRFEQSQAEKISVMLTVQKLEADLLSQEEAAKVATAATESVREELNSEIQAGRRQVEDLGRRIEGLERGMEEEEEKAAAAMGEKGRVEKELEVLREEKRKAVEELGLVKEEKGVVEKELEVVREEKGRVEDEWDEGIEEAEKERVREVEKRKEAVEELEKVLEAAMGKWEKGKAKEAEEARKAAVEEKGENEKTFNLKVAALRAKVNYWKASDRRARHGDGLPMPGPEPEEDGPQEPEESREPAQPEPPATPTGPRAIPTGPRWLPPTGPRQGQHPPGTAPHPPTGPKGWQKGQR